MKPTQAQVEAAHQAAMKKCREEGRIGPTATAITAALTAAAEVGPKPFGAGYTKGYSDGLKYAEATTIERCAQYHDNAARECDLIAAANRDNELGADCLIRALDHREDAAAIRALKEKP